MISNVISNPKVNNIMGKSVCKRFIGILLHAFERGVKSQLSFFYGYAGIHET